MTWRCPAIERSVTIYDNGVIRPCCLIDWSYSKPISEIKNPNRFSDLGVKNAACKKCIDKEEFGLESTRQYYLKLETQKPNTNNTIQYLDIRNTNLCNARCQFCGPHHTNQWPGAKLNQQNLDDFIDDIISEDLIEIYFTGGEPLISRDHATILKSLVDRGLSKTINLRYSTNLSVLKYKDVDFVDLWRQYRRVSLMPSADGIGAVYENVRQGLKWNTFESNLMYLKEKQINFQILFILCSLNIWHLKETVEYFRKNNYNFIVEVLTGPEEFKLNKIKDKQKAEQEIISCNFPEARANYFIKHLYQE